MTRLRREGGGGGFAASFKKGGAAGAAGCGKGLRKRVLKMDQPNGRRVRKFDGAFGPEG